MEMVQGKPREQQNGREGVALACCVCAAVKIGKTDHTDRCSKEEVQPDADHDDDQNIEHG